MRQGGNVDVCPVTKEAWEERAKAKSGDCGGQSVYHCLTDNEGRKWERCVEKSLMKEGFCPIFSSKGFINWKPCNISIPACPNSSYVSDEVYKYSHCFGNNSLHKQTDIDHNNADRVPVEAIIGVVVGLFILVSAAVIAVLLIYFRRKPENQNTIDEEDGLHMDLLSDEGISGDIKNSVRNNLDFVGIQEDDREDTEEVLQAFLQKKFKLDNKVQFESVHRVGKYNKSSKHRRKIVAKFTNFKDREYIRTSAREKLRGTRVYVNEHFPPEIERKRQKLYPVMKQAKKENKQTELVWDVLYIDGEMYTPPPEPTPKPRGALGQNSTGTPTVERQTNPLKRQRQGSTPDRG